MNDWPTPEQMEDARINGCTHFIWDTGVGLGFLPLDPEVRRRILLAGFDEPAPPSGVEDNG